MSLLIHAYYVCSDQLTHSANKLTENDWFVSLDSSLLSSFISSVLGEGYFIRMRLVPSNMFEPSSKFLTDRSFVDYLYY